MGMKMGSVVDTVVETAPKVDRFWGFVHDQSAFSRIPSKRIHHNWSSNMAWKEESSIYFDDFPMKTSELGAPAWLKGQQIGIMLVKQQ